MPLLKVFCWGLLVSFLGTLPLGTLNVVAMQISVQESVANGIFFVLGCLVVEMIYVRISLMGINWIRKQKTLLKWMDWIALLIIVALAVGSFIAATNEQQSKNVVFDNNLHRFLLGLLLSSINAVQIPFWFGWSTILFSKNILQPRNSFYNLYIVGIGIGTLLGNCIFVFGGRLLVEKMSASHSLINWIIGGVFSITAIIQLARILYKKNTAGKIDRLPGLS